MVVVAGQHNKREEHGKVGVHILVCLFGITSWSIMNGLWVELPILVSQLPEGWTLPSYLTVICQFGNLGPLVFSLLTYLFPSTQLEQPASLCVVTGLSLTALLYAFFWRETAHVAGSLYSIAVLSLTLVQAVFASTTSMCYVTFMAHLRARYMPTLFVGMGLSGLLPALVAIGQGTADVRCVLNTSLEAGSAAVTGTWPGGGDLTYGLLNVSNSNSSNSSNNSSNNSSHNSNSSVVSMVIDESVSILPSNQTLVALNQEPAFTVRAFFLFLGGLGFVSLCALVTLIHHPYCRSERVNTEEEDNCKLMSKSTRDEETHQTLLHEAETTEQIPLPHLPSSHLPEDSRTDMEQDDVTTQQNDVRFIQPGKLAPHTDTLATPTDTLVPPTDPDNHGVKDERGGSEDGGKREDGGEEGGRGEGGERELSRGESWFLLCLLVWINILQTSYVLAVQVYSSLPYGLYIYNITTKAENIVDPIACFVSLFVTAKSPRVISGLTSLGTLFTAYVITVAAMSPRPFLLDEMAGGVLVVCAWIMCTMFMVYAKVSIAAVMRTQGRQSLLWTGASTQLGSFIGALLAYVMINHLSLFKEGPWCQ